MSMAGSRIGIIALWGLMAAVVMGGGSACGGDWTIELSNTEPMTLTVNPATALRWWGVRYNEQFQGVKEGLAAEGDLVLRRGAFELRMDGKLVAGIDSDAVLLPGNNHLVIEAEDTEGNYKAFEFNIAGKGDNLRDAGTLSPMGQRWVRDVAEVWELTELRTGDTRPDPPSHDEVPQINRNWGPVDVPSPWYTMTTASGRREFRAETFPEPFRDPSKWAQSYWYERAPFYHYVDGWYRCRFATPKHKQGERVRLHFGAVAYEGHIFVNGEFVGMNRGSFSPFEVDITEAVYGEGEENELLVWVYTDYGETPPRHAYGNMFMVISNRAGLERPVKLMVEPTVTAKVLKVDPQLADERIHVSATLAGMDGLAEMPLQVSAKVCDMQGRVVTETNDVKRDGVKLSADIDASGLELWEPDNPTLYYVHLLISTVDGEVIGHPVSRFGYRQFEVRGRHFYLNGERVKLYFGNISTYRSRARYDRFKLFEDFYKNVKRQQAQGINAERFHMCGALAGYGAADEVGLLVMAEGPIFHRIFSNIPKKEDRQHYLEAVIPELRTFMWRTYNHPSVVLWSMSNEVWHNNLKDLYEGFYAVADEIETGTRAICPTSGLNGFGVPNYPVPTDYFDDHNYDMHGMGQTLLGRSIDRRKASVERIYGAIDKPWVCSEFHSVPKGYLRVDESLSYQENYLQNAEDNRLMRLALRDLSARDGYYRYLDTVARRVYEILRADVVFQGWHPWYGDRGHLPDFMERLASPYVVMLDPLSRVVHWYAGQQTEVNVVAMKDPAQALTGAVRVSVRRADGVAENAIQLAEQKMTLTGEDERWDGVVNVATDKLATGAYELRLELVEAGGLVLNYNDYDLTVLVKPEPVALGTANRLGYFGETEQVGAVKGMFAAGAVLVPLERAEQLSQLDRLLVLPNAWESLGEVIHVAELHKWLEAGGRLLILEQQVDEQGAGPCGYQFVNSLKTANNYADILIEDHPAFAGLTPGMFRDFVGNENLVVETALSPLSENVIAAAGKFAVLLHGSVGKGEVIASQFKAVDKVGRDPVAERYLCNLLGYFVGDADWSGLVPLIEQEGLLPAEVTELKWHPVSLDGFVNRSTRDGQAGQVGLFDLGTMDLRHVPQGKQDFFGIDFYILPDSGANIIALKGTKIPQLPETVGPIPMGQRQCRYLAFLHTAYYCNDKPVITYEITYSDGSTRDIVAVGNKQIGDWYGPKNLPHALAWNRAHPQCAVELGVYLFVWENPVVNLPITSVTLKSAGGSVPVVLGISTGWNR